MTDKDKMLKEFHEWRLQGWQAAKESDRKELEAAKQRIAELESIMALTPNGARVIDAAMARIEVLKEGKDTVSIRAYQATSEALYKAVAEKEALEKKLAEQQAWVQKAVEICAIYECTPRWEQMRSLTAVEGELQSRLLAFRELKKLAGQQLTEELTKLLAEARKEGFEEGKQAGRDELQKEQSEQEPVGFVWRKYCVESNSCSKEISDDLHHAKSKDGEAFAVIPRPLPPQVKGE